MRKIIGLIIAATLFTSHMAPIQTYAAPAPAYSQEDLRMMSAIIFLEAGNQCYEGQQAVGIVVMNRVRSELFPDNIYDVLWQRGQFFNPSCKSFWYSCLEKYDKGEIPHSCITAAMCALEGNTILYYNNQYLDFSNFLYFARYRRDCKIRIQDHQFS